MKIQIKHRFTASVIFEHDCERNSMRLTVELALKSRASLSRADLSGAYLSGAYLSGANLSGAYLSGADLSGASLSRADLSGAYLSGADLSGADLSGAYLSGASLSGANLSGANLSRAYLSGADLSGAYLSGADLANDEKLVGKRPVFQIGPIGSRCAYFTAYITDKGLRFDAGCQHQITREVFEDRLAEEHGGNDHAKEYRAALALVDAHAEIWTPKEEQAAETDVSSVSEEV